MVGSGGGLCRAPIKSPAIFSSSSSSFSSSSFGRDPTQSASTPHTLIQSHHTTHACLQQRSLCSPQSLPNHHHQSSPTRTPDFFSARPTAVKDGRSLRTKSWRITLVALPEGRVPKGSVREILLPRCRPALQKVVSASSPPLFSRCLLPPFQSLV